MVSTTQHIVASITGAEELLHRTEEVFQGRSKNIVFIENGFQIYSEGLPYYFQVSYYEEIGWNVFLSSISGTIEDHVETDNLYRQLEDAIDTVNLAFYTEEELEHEKIAYNFFKLKALTQEKISEFKEVAEIKDTGRYVLKIAFHDMKGFPLELGYSPIFNRWYYDQHNQEITQVSSEHPSFREYMEELDYVIGNLNRSM